MYSLIFRGPKQPAFCFVCFTRCYLSILSLRCIAFPLFAANCKTVLFSAQCLQDHQRVEKGRVYLQGTVPELPYGRKTPTIVQKKTCTFGRRIPALERPLWQPLPRHAPQKNTRRWNLECSHVLAQHWEGGDHLTRSGPTSEQQVSTPQSFGTGGLQDMLPQRQSKSSTPPGPHWGSRCISLLAWHGALLWAWWNNFV